MWEDNILYWAWRGNHENYTQPPTVKTIVYKEVYAGDAIYKEAIAVIEEPNLQE